MTGEEDTPPWWRLIDPLPDGSWLYHPLTRRVARMYLAETDEQKNALVRFHARTRSLAVMMLLGAGLSVVLLGGIAGPNAGGLGALALGGFGLSQHLRERRTLLRRLHIFLEG